MAGTALKRPSCASLLAGDAPLMNFRNVDGRDLFVLAPTPMIAVIIILCALPGLFGLWAIINIKIFETAAQY